MIKEALKPKPKKKRVSKHNNFFRDSTSKKPRKRDSNTTE